MEPKFKEKFNQFINERINNSSSIQTNAAYLIVKEFVNNLIKPDHSTDAHSHLLVDFDNPPLEGTVSFKAPDNWKEKESIAIETVEEAAETFSNGYRIVHKHSAIDGFINGAHSEAAKNYWFEKFKQEQL